MSSVNSTLGLTGSVGSGKSHVLRGLQDTGLNTLDCDQVVRELLWGDSPDSHLLHADLRSASQLSHLTRDALRQWLLKGEVERKTLERLIHPHVVSVVEERAQAIQRGEVLIVEGTRLAESGLLQRMGGVFVLDAPRSLRLERVLKRGGLTELEFDRLDAIQDYSKLEHKRLARLINDQSTDLAVRQIVNLIQDWGLM
jgi:dephospho-CoA kinase